MLDAYRRQACKNVPAMATPVQARMVHHLPVSYTNKISLSLFIIFFLFSGLKIIFCIVLDDLFSYLNHMLKIYHTEILSYFY
jgi:hypothetical protein